MSCNRADLFDVVALLFGYICRDSLLAAEDNSGNETDNRASRAKSECRRHAGFDTFVKMVV
jgi:hypothetical protein